MQPKVGHPPKRRKLCALTATKKAPAAARFITPTITFAWVQPRGYPVRDVLKYWMS